MPDDPTVTDTQIEALADAARRMGNWTHLALCQRALNLLSLEPPHAPDEYRVAVARARTLSVPDAREECRRILTARPPV
jgi:hypothetical protein